MRTPAIPALTRGWFSAPARIRLVDAARTRPPAVSAVIRLRAPLAGGRAFFRGIRLGASARPRILAAGGVAGLFFRGGLASGFISGGGRVLVLGFLGIGGAGRGGGGSAGLGGEGGYRFLSRAGRGGRGVLA